MQQVTQNPEILRELQVSLDAFFDSQLDFEQLRTRWITELAEKPEMRDSAVRLLYKQPRNENLTDKRALCLKRIVETAIHTSGDDWTVEFDDDEAESHEDFDRVEAAAIELTRKTASFTANQLLPSEPKTEAVADLPARLDVGSTDPVMPGLLLGGRYELKSQLAIGGFGVVFKALDRLRQKANADTSDIVVKLLRKEYRSNPKMQASLQRGALQAQSLTHPNIARVYDFHRDGEIVFMTMELLEGSSLSTIISQLQPATMRAEQAMHVIVGLCRGLAHAHAYGFVHADFKPSNIIVMPDDEPKILDFGLARVESRGNQSLARGDDSDGSAAITITPAYASCNRLESGIAEFTDDIYSLSCVIYELLAGRHPFDKKSALVARELKLKPERIKGITDTQWNALATGLSLVKKDRTIRANDMLRAFTDRVPSERDLATLPLVEQVPIRPARHAEESSKFPAARRRGIWGTIGAVFAGTLIGAAIVILFTVSGVQPLPPKYADLVANSWLVQELQSRFDLRANESAANESLPALETTRDAKDDATAAAEDLRTELPADASISSISDPLLSGTGTDTDTRTDTATTATLNADPVVPVADTPDALPEELSAAEISPPASSVSGTEPSTKPLAGIPVFQLESAQYVVRESATAVAVVVNRGGDLSVEASIAWFTVAGTAEPQEDYAEFNSNTAHFAAGEKSQTIFIPIISDATEERDEQFQIALGRPGAEMTVGEPFIATITILDDDF